jgi:CcmD family protein
MGTLMAGFGIAWLMVVAYVTWMGVQQRRLERQCEQWMRAMQAREHFGETTDDARSRAA